jgi:hypothetical protein
VVQAMQLSFSLPSFSLIASSGSARKQHKQWPSSQHTGETRSHQYQGEAQGQQQRVMLITVADLNVSLDQGRASTSFILSSSCIKQSSLFYIFAQTCLEK